MSDLMRACACGAIIYGALGLVALLASLVTSSLWANDCRQLGLTHHNGTIYECKVKQ